MTASTRDLNALLRVWKRVGKESTQTNKPKLIYSDQDLILRTLRDTLDSSVQEILVDDEEALQQVRQYLKAFLPRTKIKLQHYEDATPLFSRYRLEPQIERIYDRRVALPGGGHLFIEPTRALVAVDVNTGRDGTPAAGLKAKARVKYATAEPFAYCSAARLPACEALA